MYTPLSIIISFRISRKWNNEMLNSFHISFHAVFKTSLLSCDLSYFFCCRIFWLHAVIWLTVLLYYCSYHCSVMTMGIIYNIINAARLYVTLGNFGKYWYWNNYTLVIAKRHQFLLCCLTKQWHVLSQLHDIQLLR